MFMLLLRGLSAEARVTSMLSNNNKDIEDAHMLHMDFKEVMANV